MAIRPPNLISTPRPDNTQSVVGEDGQPIAVDNAKQLIRVGVGGANANWGPGREDITDTAVQVANPTDIGGTGELSGIVNSLNDEPLSVVIVWESETSYDSTSNAESASDALVERPPDITNDTENLIEVMTVKSDSCTIFVEDESAGGVTNNIEYTLNFHG